jgi:hypothetical protein
MNKLFYRDLRDLVLAAHRRNQQFVDAVCATWNGRLIATCGEEDPRIACCPSLDRPRVSQPNSDNDVTGPTC